MNFDFLYKFIWSIYHSKKNLERYCRQCENVFMYSTRNACQILTKFKFSRQIFEIISSTNFHQNPSSGSEFYHADRRTDRRTNGRDRQTWQSQQSHLAILRKPLKKSKSYHLSVPSLSTQAISSCRFIHIPVQTGISTCATHMPHTVLYHTKYSRVCMSDISYTTLFNALETFAILRHSAACELKRFTRRQ
jgi:hypothetical protein